MQRKTNNNLLVPTDFSEVANNALSHATTIAKAYGNEITLLNIIEEGFMGGIFGKSQHELVSEAVQARLDKMANDIAQQHNIKVHTRLETGRIYKTIAEIANTENFDSIVMGSHGASGLEQVIGSNASRTIQYSDVPVVVVKNKPIAAAGYKKIVLPFDLTMESRQKVDWAIHVGKTFNSEIHVVYTSSDDEYVKTATKASIRNVEHSLAEAGIKFESHEIEDQTMVNFAKEVLAYAESINADLIIVMTHTDKGISEIIIGTLTQQLVNKSENIPVMCIHPRETGVTYSFS